MKSDLLLLIAIIDTLGKKFVFIALRDLLKKLKLGFYLVSMLFMGNVPMML